MPPDLPYRRSERFDADLLAKMSRGEVACAECRRLKLRCDKKPAEDARAFVPQPDTGTGALESGQGSRYVLADTTHLHSKLAVMGKRIRELEDALAVLDETHPLLAKEFLEIKFGTERAHIEDTHESPESLDALGTLTISEGGETQYFGRSAGSEALFITGASQEHDPDPGLDHWIPHSLSPEIVQLSDNFLSDHIFNSGNSLFLTILDYFPDHLRAWSLCELYLEQFSWSFTPIKRDELIDDYLVPIYQHLKDRRSDEDSLPAIVTPHRCAVLFIVFAIGTWVDLTLEDYMIDAIKFYHLCRACLSMQSLLNSPDISTIHALSLLSAFSGIEGRKSTTDSSWFLSTLAVKLGQSLGLHRDSARWKLEPKTVERRRHLFWELTAHEMLRSMVSGRPPSIRFSYVDAELPADVGALDTDGKPMVGFHRWKHEFVRELYSDVIETILTAVPPKYSAIIELDRRVREKTLPAYLDICHSGEYLDNMTPRIYFQSCLLGNYRSVLLLLIHRSWFAQALLDHPANPLRSPYAPSFLATYRSASSIIKGIIMQYQQFHKLCTRLWHPWTHLFSSAIVVGSIVIHAPSSSMAQKALVELELACETYEKGALRSRSRRNQHGWRVLQKLRDKARDRFSEYHNGNTPSPPAFTAESLGDDELAIFGGHARLIVSKNPVSSPPTSSPSPPSADQTSAHTSPGETIPDIHPSLIDYLNSAPTTHGPSLNTIEGFANPVVFDLGTSAWQSAGLSQVENQNWFDIALSMPTSNMQSKNVQDWSPGIVPSFNANHAGSTGNLFAPAADTQGIDTQAGLNDQWQSFLRQSNLFPQ